MGSAECFSIETGVKQGCGISLQFFDLYTGHIIRGADTENAGVKIGGRNLTNLHYAHDTALLSNNITIMKRVLYRVDAAGTKTRFIIKLK